MQKKMVVVAFLIVTMAVVMAGCKQDSGGGVGLPGKAASVKDLPKYSGADVANEKEAKDLLDNVDSAFLSFMYSAASKIQEPDGKYQGKASFSDWQDSVVANASFSSNYDIKGGSTNQVPDADGKYPIIKGDIKKTWEFTSNITVQKAWNPTNNSYSSWYDSAALPYVRKDGDKWTNKSIEIITLSTEQAFGAVLPSPAGVYVAGVIKVEKKSNSDDTIKQGSDNVIYPNYKPGTKIEKGEYTGDHTYKVSIALSAYNAAPYNADYNISGGKGAKFFYSYAETEKSKARKSSNSSDDAKSDVEVYNNDGKKIFTLREDSNNADSAASHYW